MRHLRSSVSKLLTRPYDADCKHLWKHLWKHYSVSLHTVEYVLLDMVENVALPPTVPAPQPRAYVKIPANVDGLIHFATEVSQQFSLEEKRAMVDSESGVNIARALNRCNGIKEKLRAARAEWAKDNESKANIQNLESQKGKYFECLAYMACQERWAQYTLCWKSLGNSTPKELERLQEMGPQSACPNERAAIELCVGRLVSSTIRAAETSVKEASASGSDLVDDIII